MQMAIGFSHLWVNMYTNLNHTYSSISGSNVRNKMTGLFCVHPTSFRGKESRLFNSFAKTCKTGPKILEFPGGILPSSI